jgi:ribonucleoside-diphosphate reductase beta chain
MVLISESDNPLFKHDRTRFNLLPARDKAMWAMHKRAHTMTWFAEDVTLEGDQSDWRELDENTQWFIKHVLGFFATADGIVNENLILNVCGRIRQTDVRAFYIDQMHIESIHAEMYSLLLMTYITDSKELQRLMAAIEEVPCIKRKSDWALKWINNTADKLDDVTEEDFAELIVAFAAVEGIFFSGSFCAIFWLKERHRGKLKAMIKANQKIREDEALHTDGACYIYRKYLNNLTPDRILEIITGAVNCEIEFITDALPVTLIGMSAVSMIEYIKYVADRLLAQLGCGEHYHDKNPFDFMEKIALQVKSNFFECDEVNYKMGGEHSRAVIGDDGTLNIDEDC